MVVYFVLHDCGRCRMPLNNDVQEVSGLVAASAQEAHVIKGKRVRKLYNRNISCMILHVMALTAATSCILPYRQLVRRLR